jgi:hypothetical protein
LADVVLALAPDEKVEPYHDDRRTNHTGRTEKWFMYSYLSSLI